MPHILTLTLNPTIDVAYEVDKVFHTHKMRTRNERHDPGGGGINVARVLARLGSDVRACYMAGGPTGLAFDNLVERHGLAHSRIAIAGDTRTSVNALELESGKEYRFVSPGPTVSESEWQLCLERLAELPCDMLVISGSLPPGMPEDFYAQVQQQMARRGVPVVLDSSGAALRAGVACGGLLLIKPSRGELQTLAGTPLDSIAAVSAAAASIVARGLARHVAVTLGHEGAVLAHDGGTMFLPAIPVEAKSAVGAGDSFVAAMVHALGNQWDITDAFRYGIAAGAAAVLTPGADLCHREDIDRLYHEMPPR